MNADGRQSEDIRPATVHRAYGRVAQFFDGYVRTIPGYHAHLRVSASRMGLSGGGLRLLDVGCGTGASTEALLTAAPGAEVVAADASAEMLGIARRKNWPPRVTFVHSRLETLAEAGVEGPFDGILAAYLVSNLPDAEIGLRRLLTLLKPGAPIAVHDYAVGGARSRSRWASASWGYLLPMASLRWHAPLLSRYRYRRVRSAGGVATMVHRMQRAGFVDVRVQTMGGVQQHLVHTFLGRRPDEPDVVGERARSRARAAAAEAESREAADGVGVPQPDDVGPDEARSEETYTDEAHPGDQGPRQGHGGAADRPDDDEATPPQGSPSV
ncbi:class I SAM-dependent methyltransferase [Pseudonocardia phyllosphaerae]|uniref:class I SAM-dependent methyltransferase n=1 Tax=Pseudonocardia phyllosphaerae TaxID=3390502 RepID=UPI00397C4B20